MKKATDRQVVAAYEATKSVWKTASLLGMCGQSVHQRLARLGKTKPINIWRSEDDEILRREYVALRDAGRLIDLAGRLNRTVPFLSRQARRLGLTNARAKKPYHGHWKYMSEPVATSLLAVFKKSSYGLLRFCRKHGYAAENFSATMRRYFPDEWEHIIELKTPRQSKYRIGRAFEYAVRDRLRAIGWFVLRSPASKSPIDLVAIRLGRVLFVQCKRGGCLAVGDWNELFDLATACGAVPVVAGRPSGTRPQYWVIQDRKDGSKSPQPWVEVEIQALTTTPMQRHGPLDQVDARP